MMEKFRRMVNDCVTIGIENNASTMKKLCNLAYKQLACYDILSYYKLCAISHGAGILANRRKSIKRGMNPRKPFASKPLLVSCYGFKIIGGILKIPVGNKQFYDIPLNRHVRDVLSDPSYKIRSFTLTAEGLSICISKQVTEIECIEIEGVDRNLRNLTVGNYQQVKQYDLSKAVQITDNTRLIMKSFKGNDIRITKRLYGKYGRRRKNRIDQLLHHVSKAVVRDAKQNRAAIAFEDIRYIRKLYQRGNYQGRHYRSRMNSWSFAQVKRQIEYKAAWEGVPVIQLSIKETRGTSKLCPRCGKKITQVDRKKRQLWCAYCKRWMDRDIVAAMNLSIEGLQRFCSSQGLAGEAMKGNPDMPVILRVDASKLTFRHEKS
jgi:putative transposase